MKTLTTTSLAVLMTTVALTTVLAQAQSLAETARREQSRRSGVTTPGKTYTNADLKPDFPPPPAATSPALVEVRTIAQPPEPPASARTTGDNASPNTVAAPDKIIERNDTYTEAYWRAGATSIHQRLASARQNQSALNSAPDTDNDRERARVAAALARASADVVSLEAELHGFESRAAQMKVPKAWIQ